MKKHNHRDQLIETAARSWAVYLHSGEATPENIAAFDAWLAQDHAHARAFGRYQKLMNDLALIPELADVPLQRDAPVRLAHTPRQLVAALTIMVALIGGGVVVFGMAGNPPRPVPVYETAIAEIRDIHLADGSVVTLGARSRIEPNFTDDIRIVKLSGGEAFFDVVSDPERPFYVQAGDRLIRVVGTRFDVRQGLATVRIAVVEGSVEVLQSDDPQKAEATRAATRKDVLRAGDEVVARIGSPEKTISAIEPGEAAPWRRGWLTYENASLGEILADANRYSAREIVFDGTEIEDLHMTTAFSIEKIDVFVEGLEAAYGLDADYSDAGRITLSRP